MYARSIDRRINRSKRRSIYGLVLIVWHTLYRWVCVSMRSTSWASDFLEGCTHDIYQAFLPPYLDGFVSYSFLLYFLYHELHVVPIGISSPGYDLRLMPSKLMVSRNHTIFVLSESPDLARRIESLPIASLQKYVSRLYREIYL
jgi:hypothetical protein